MKFRAGVKEFVELSQCLPQRRDRGVVHHLQICSLGMLSIDPAIDLRVRTVAGEQ